MNKRILEDLEKNLNKFIETNCKDEQFELYEIMGEQINDLKETI